MNRPSPSTIGPAAPSRPLPERDRPCKLAPTHQDRESALIEGSGRIRIATALLTDTRKRMLLVRKRGTLAFMQPGGKIESGEEPAEALLRELREELNLVASPEALRYRGRFAAPAANEPGFIVEADVFLLAIATEPEPAAEIAELRWLEPGHDAPVPVAPLTRDHVMPLWRRETAEIVQDE